MRKCICNIFARQLPPSPDVTSQTLIYAFTKLHVSCFGFVKDRIYGSWFGLIFFEVRRIIVQLNSLRSHFFTTLLLLDKFAGSCGFCEIRTCTDECFHFWSAVLLITSTNFKYVRIVYCLSDHLIWIIHSVDAPTWRLEEGSSISTRSSACSGLLSDV